MADGTPAVERRKVSRSTVLDCARRVVGDRVHGCVIPDRSGTGTRRHAAAAARLPARLELRLEGALSIAAPPCWGRGMEPGPGVSR